MENTVEADRIQRETAESANAQLLTKHCLNATRSMSVRNIISSYCRRKESLHIPENAEPVKARQWKVSTCLRPHLEKHEQKMVRKSKRDKTEKKGFATVKPQIVMNTHIEPLRLREPTCADELLLLHLSHVVPPQMWRGHALRVETQAGALS